MFEHHLDEGKLWSFLRDTLQHGAAISADYANRPYEEYSARLDGAARERAELFGRRVTAVETRPCPSVHDHAWAQIIGGKRCVRCGEQVAERVTEETPDALGLYHNRVHENDGPVRAGVSVKASGEQP